MVVIDPHLARGASNRGLTFHDRGGPYGRRTKSAKRVGRRRRDGLPVGALVVPTSIHEDRASELMVEHQTRQGVSRSLTAASDARAAWRSRSEHHNFGNRLAPVARIATTLRHLSRGPGRRCPVALAA